jgi:diadenosine tetraphosphate (Ap4A) HIT family hydrolase
MNGKCPFCDPEAGRVIASAPFALALHDGFPISPGHSLIVPRRHIATLVDLEPDEATALWALLKEVRARLDSERHPDGYNVGINDGTAAGQTVMHLHVHLIPRYHGDRLDPRGGIRWVIPEKADYWSRRG